MSYARGQDLNEWIRMLHEIYGRTQNYGKSEFEIFAHLTEVCSAFGKHALKKNDLTRARRFLPKMFAWAIALLRKVQGEAGDAERALLSKYPGVCPYCALPTCTCWSAAKPEPDVAKLKGLYLRQKPKQIFSLDEMQVMFRRIYEPSWTRGDQLTSTQALQFTFSRLVEELGELGEAIRLHHLYPANFENEFADYLAWWFALVSLSEEKLATEIVWSAYPGYCTDCQCTPCDCRPGPVRELLSKPALLELAFIDAVTQAMNKAAYERDVEAFASKAVPIPLPIAVARLDIDDFKNINSRRGHHGGDEALQTIANALRRKLRSRDRIYRVGGDEFAVLFTDYSVAEASGALGRVMPILREASVGGEPYAITMSIGVCAARSPEELRDAFKKADELAEQSKQTGKDRITSDPE